MRLAALRIRNFECIGGDGVEVIIDDIVVLIGPNNAGKSAILDAYGTFASAGAELPLSCYHNENPALPVEVEGVFTDVTPHDQEKIGKKWVHADPRFGECVKVQWRWISPSEKGKKSSWDHESGQWQEGGMGGFDSLLQSCIPAPIRVSPRDDPATIEAKVTEILTEVVKGQLKDDSSKTAHILAELTKLTQSISDEIKGDIQKACSLIESKISAIFPGHVVEFVSAIGKFEPEKSIGTGSHIRVRQTGATAIPLSQQGTGLQRAFLWSALSALAELGRLKHGRSAIGDGRPKVLLIDEPECFLHPPTVRAAREALYSIAELPGWQVMATTHSAVFIDVAKPHTTIIRISRDAGASPRVFSTDRAAFDAEQRDRLRMVRACHPTVNEFFFADHVYLVEGETEQVVLSRLLETGDPEWSRTRHVVNCMGKANIPLFARILNQFGVPYTVLHDADAPRVQRSGKWQTNGMWTTNRTILESVKERPVDLPASNTVVHVPDFEGYYFGTSLNRDKPYQALLQVTREDFETAPELERLRLLRAMLSGSEHPATYQTVTALQELVAAWVTSTGPSPLEAWDFREEEGTA